MVDWTAGPRKQFWNRSFIYGLLAVTLVFLSQVASCQNDDSVDCSRLRTCTKCAEKPLCSWSLKQQRCVMTSQGSELLMVNIRKHCPQFTIVDSFDYKMQLPVTYKVKVSNDVSGFVKHLSKSNITCSMRGVTYNGTVTEAEDGVICTSTSNSDLEFDKERLMIYHHSVTFDNVTLRVDDGVNNYFTVYNTLYCDIGKTSNYCVTCSWDSELYAFYYKRCSADNACTGLFEYYDRRNATGIAEVAVDTAALLTGPGPSADACPDIAIQSVEPLSAPWSGGATLVITVKNHDVLVESRKVTVTVAGRDCVYPKTINRETISCTVGPPKPDDSVAGPVRVLYGPLLLTSAQTFRFIYPEPTGLSPACGPLTGGTMLRITGRSLDAGSTVTVSVGPDNVPCEVVTWYKDRVLCLTGPSDRPVAGDVTVVFDKFLRRTVGVNSTGATPPSKPAVQFVYAGDPVLEKRQQFSGIASGGTYIPVRGSNLACLSNVMLYVDDPDGVRHYADCAVHNDTFMECRSPALVMPLSSAADAYSSLNFGFRIHFANHTLDLSPQSDFPGYRLYADPVFTDFETNGRNLTINGRHVDWGYQPSADLTIRLRNAKGVKCTVIDIQRRRIVCARPLMSATDGDLRELYVTVGHEFARTVKKKNSSNRFAGVFFGMVNAFLLIFGMFIGVCLMALLIIAIYLVWTKRCNFRRY